MTTLGIILLCIGLGIIGPIIANPILSLIYFEIYKRKDWIRYNDAIDNKRFYKWNPYANEGVGGVEQIEPVRPRISDWWEDFTDSYSCFWWAPVTGAFCTIGLVCYLILKPFSDIIQKLFDFIKNIKI